MQRLALALVVSTFVVGPALYFSNNTARADNACTVKAVSKDGKALTGAAKTSSMKKCCEDTALSKDGKKLSGAARTSYLTKCEAGN
jgi:hypothetical protein